MTPLKTLLTALTLATATVAAAKQAPPPPPPPSPLVLYVGGHVAPPPGPSDAPSSRAPCVTVVVITSDGESASSEACPGGGATDAAVGWPFVVAVPLPSPPPVALLVTAAAGAGPVWRRVILVNGTAASVAVEWGGGARGVVVDAGGAPAGCAHCTAVLAVSSMAAAALLVGGLALLAWTRARAEGEARVAARDGDGGRWARAPDGRLTRDGVK